MADSRQSMTLYSPQKPFAEHDIVIEYIVVFKSSASDEQIEDAIKNLHDAGMHDLVLGDL